MPPGDLGLFDRGGEVGFLGENPIDFFFAIPGFLGDLCDLLTSVGTPLLLFILKGFVEFTEEKT